MTTRDYPTTGLTIHWDSGVCAHSGICAATLPRVFRPSDTPWIDADAATADEIALTIDHCPSGALRYTRAVADASAAGNAQEDSATRATVTVHARGPLEVYGEMTVVSADGTTLRESRRQYFCRCGSSGSKPFCDGSHTRVRFDDDGLGPGRRP